MKVLVDLDWYPVDGPTGPSWKCEALGCVFAAFPATEADGWRLTSSNKSVPGLTRPIGRDGNFTTFEKAPVWATKEDCFAAVRHFIKTQAEKAQT